MINLLKTSLKILYLIFIFDIVFSIKNKVGIYANN